MRARRANGASPISGKVDIKAGNPGRPEKKNTVTENAEARRLEEIRSGVQWRKWGPYLSERQWGTVREDYSYDGNAGDDQASVKGRRFIPEKY